MNLRPGICGLRSDTQRLRRRSVFGFTLIELLIVLAILALMATLVVPRYFQNIDVAKETFLEENLRVTREMIDKYYGDTGHYPASLNELVEKKYIKALPVDPVTGNASTWIIIPPEDPSLGGIYDLRSGAPGNRRDGKPFSAL